mgnify:CR=1 FL=1
MTELNFVAVPAIVVIAWFIGFIIKSLTTSSTAEKLIPIICGVIGMVLGVIIFITNPELIPATDWPSAVATGIVSGLSATGVHQIYKQLTKNN